MKKLLLFVSLCLLGSARGASGQPDEPPGSMSYQASVQQFSGQYFSPANPSDAEALYEFSSGKNTLNEKPSDEHHAPGEHVAGEHASGEQPSSEQPAGEKLSVEQPAGEQPSGEKPLDEKSLGEQPAGEEDPGEKPVSEQLSGSPPSSTFSGPVVNCHTCSYMNDQGKCLHGEGVCSTQNSQQCMLKKIFKDGKLQYMVQGCKIKCSSMNPFSKGIRVQITCCHNLSFCNKI
ncbi:acrosomal protein SP-10-like [Manis pentadactyla]|uniref:acrosomal protein SP-10-like n=1 Tax=Manis pentadactyla TaxID=143292 RepID=UPI00255D11A1|nr:acrosomal protein SP-10-like [Manis pentadactyla]